MKNGEIINALLTIFVLNYSLLMIQHLVRICNSNVNDLSENSS